MSRDLSKEDVATLEGILDRSDMRGIVDALCGICVEKAEHVEHTWQDRETSKWWARTASKLAKFHQTLEKMNA